ncbi:MAG: OmpA family protein [Sphingobacteriales bacterium]|nr:MAG: OmpA family protein [Sphingobacteriales bacterium]
MADLHVQPKKKNNWLPWLLLLLGLIALIVLLSRGCNNDRHDSEAVPVTDTVTRSTTTTTTSNAVGDWNGVDFNAPAVQYEEVSNKDIEVRGNDQYSIYGVGEDILFDKGSATLRSDAEQNLQQIAASIQKRHNAGNVRIYGYTDASGSADANQELSARRAEAVRDWLTSKGSISAGRLSMQAQGESQPVASNQTESGRQQNRRVEIVARGQ